MIDDLTIAVSDPASPDYSREHPAYLPTADSSQPYFTTEHTPEGSSSPPEVAVKTRLIAAEILAPLDPGSRMIALEFNEYLKETSSGEPGWDIDHYGDDGPPRTLWEYYDHPTMMRAITTNADVVAVNQQAEDWSKAADELPQLARRLEMASVDGGWGLWKGPAATAAAQQFAQIAAWVADVARGAFSAGQQQTERAHLLEVTQIHMKAAPPVEFDPRAANTRLDQMTDPTEIARQIDEDQQALQRQYDAHARAARLMNLYDRTLAASGKAPTFPPPPLSAPDPADISTQHTNPTPMPELAPTRHAPAEGRTSDVPTPPAHRPPGTTPSSTPAASPAAPAPSLALPDAASRPAESTTAAAATTQTPSGGVTSDLPARNPATGAPAAVPGMDNQRPPLGLLGAPRPFVPERGAAIGKVPAPGASAPGGRSGELPPGVSTRSGTGGAARPGITGREPLAPHSGTAPVTGGSRRKQDDEQRRSTPYVDLDTPTIFETDERTAPPTIGEHDGR